MDSLYRAAAHVTGGNGHFVSGHRKPARWVEARDNRDGVSSDGDDQPVRLTVARPVRDASSSPDAAAAAP